MKRALIVQGGWDGQQPKQVSEVFTKILEMEKELSASVSKAVAAGVGIAGCQGGCAAHSVKT